MNIPVKIKIKKIQGYFNPLDSTTKYLESINDGKEYNSLEDLVKEVETNAQKIENKEGLVKINVREFKDTTGEVFRTVVQEVTEYNEENGGGSLTLFVADVI